MRHMREHKCHSIVLYTGTSGKQSSHDMHELHDDTGRGPGGTGPPVGRHRPIAVI